MKIGILTLTLHTNYGGILQAYALQTVLERMGHEVVVFNRPYTPLKTKWTQIPKRIVKRLLGHDVVIFSERRYNREAPILNQHIWEFRKKYIHEKIIDKLTDIKEGDVDCIVVGSDQIWRPKYFKEQWCTGIEDAYLAFTKGWNIKRIAYAASFGVDTWEYTPEETKKCREAIKEFDFISVREDSGVKLINNYLGVVDANHVLDPTFLLNMADYVSLLGEKVNTQTDGDLLIYYLNVDSNKKMYTRQIAFKNKLTPFYVNRTLMKNTRPLVERVLPSVEYWLKGFYDAKLVITDSFHACVFSIIFQVPFAVFENKSRGNSRILSLLDLFGMKGHIIDERVLNETMHEFIIPNSVHLKLVEFVNSSLNRLNQSL